MSDNNQVTIFLFYDDYEYTFGDGFYPLFENNEHNSLSSIQITFRLIDGMWIQDNNINVKCIRGLDGNEGGKLLLLLNGINKSTSNVIKNSINKIIYPKPQKN